MYAPYGTLGNSGRNSLNNPNVFNWDFSIVKDTKLNEKISMQFRAEFFDVLNHPNFFYGSQTYLMGTPRHRHSVGSSLPVSFRSGCL